MTGECAAAWGTLNAAALWVDAGGLHPEACWGDDERMMIVMPVIIFGGGDDGGGRVVMLLRAVVAAVVVAVGVVYGARGHSNDGVVAVMDCVVVAKVI